MIQFPSNPNFSFTETCPLPYQYYEQDVAAVLDSVKLLFFQYFKDVDSRPLNVINVYPHEDCPMAVYEENTIYLSVSPLDKNGNPGMYWCQFIYQFSHEFCHYMNFGHVVQSMRWFEECLCTLASHFFLIKSAEQWAKFPPYPNWAAYSPNIHFYEISQRDDISPINISELSKRHSDLLTSLENNEYQRPKNQYIALKLLPLFIDNPALWNIVPYLTSLSSDNCFSENLKLLGDLSREDISKVLNFFGIVK